MRFLFSYGLALVVIVLIGVWMATGTRDGLTSRPSKVRTCCRSSQNLAIGDRCEERGARAAIESPEACGLQHGETQSWHLAVLALRTP